MPTVTVKVPQRQSSDGSTFPGYGSAGLYWPTGETTKEVTAEQLKQLLADSASSAPIMVILLPDPPPEAPAEPKAPAAPPAPSADTKATPKSK